MPRTCTICAHAARAAIEAALIAGTPLRDIALRHGVGHMALQRHKETHIPAAVAEHQAAREAAQALDVVKQLKAINGATLAILHDARKAHDPDTALKAIDRIQRQIELQAKLLVDLDERPEVNLVIAPEWVTFRTTLILALEPIPYTLALAYHDIGVGTPPRVALNEFLHAWFESTVDRRATLVAEPITTAPVARDAASWRWAVFCAAAADWLCAQDGVEPPGLGG